MDGSDQKQEDTDEAYDASYTITIDASPRRNAHGTPDGTPANGCPTFADEQGSEQKTPDSEIQRIRVMNESRISECESDGGTHSTNESGSVTELSTTAKTTHSS